MRKDNVDVGSEKWVSPAQSKRLLDLLIVPSGAGEYGDQEVAESIKGGSDVNIRSSLVRHGAGARPLHLAAKNTHAGIVEALISAGARVGAKMADGASVLHLAALNKKEAPGIIDVLIKEGGLVDALDKEGASPLAWALRPRVTGGSGGVAAAKRLLNHGAGWATFASCKTHPLAEAVGALQENAVVFMIENGAPVSEMGRGPVWALRALVDRASFRYHGEGESARKALDQALRIAEALLAAGCPVDDPELINHGLCSNAPAELLRRLRTAGVPIAKSDGKLGSYGPGPARLAMESRLDRLLVAFDLGLDKEWSEGGMGLLGWAMNTRYVGRYETVTGLLRAGCDPNSKQGSGETPLARAVAQRVKEAGPILVKILLAAGARPDEPCGPKQVSALAQAVNQRTFGVDGYVQGENVGEIAKALVEGGANINQLVEGVPLLCHASSKDRKSLIELGASASGAIAWLCEKGSALEMLSRYHIDEWVKAGADPDDFIKGYPVAMGRLGERNRKWQEGEGLLSYLEALSLKKRVDNPLGPSDPKKPLRM